MSINHRALGALAPLILAAGLTLTAGSAPAGAETVTLHSVSKDLSAQPQTLTVIYSKDFATCAHLLTSDGQGTHSGNFFCAQGNNVSVTQPLSAFPPIQNNTVSRVKLCHGNNYGVCSALVQVPSLTLFLDETSFLQASDAVIRVTYPTPKGQNSTYVENGVTLFNLNRFSVGNSTPLLAGNEVFSIVGPDNLDITFADPVLAFGIRLQDGCLVGCADSQFTFTLKRAGVILGVVTVDPPIDVASFVGVVSSARFDRVEIREIVGGSENDFFGAILASPEPSEVFYPADTLPNNDPVDAWIPSAVNGGVSLSGDGRLLFRDTSSVVSIYQRNVAALRIGASWTMEFRANYQAGSLWTGSLSELNGRWVGICFVENNQVSDCGALGVTSSSPRFIIPGVDPRGWHVWRIEKDGVIEARIYKDGALIRAVPYGQLPAAVARGGAAVFGAGGTATTATVDLDYLSYKIGAVNQLADLSISNTDSPDPVTVGSKVTYTIQVTNNGPSAAKAVTVTDTLPAGVSLVSASPGCSGIGTVTCALGDMASNSTTTLTVVVNVPAGVGPVLTNTASVITTSLESNSSNNAATATTTVIVETTPPTTTATPSPGPNAAGWNNTNMTVDLAAVDDVSGSGVKEIRFTLSGAQPGLGIVSGASTSVTVTVEGITTISFYAVDNAGNQEAAKTITVRIDKTPPTITGTRTPAANAAGWNNADVSVSFTCADALSDIASCPAVQSVTTEGAGQSRTGTAIDKAGNQASATLTGINIDKTPPVITGSRAPLANAAGWNNVDVTVSFTCTDVGSGVESCGASQVVTTEGAAQSRTGTATDKAGNQASATVAGINIDKTPPLVTGARAPAANAAGWNNADVTVSFTCADALSGIESCPASQVVSTDGAGQLRTGTATDKAGNQASGTVGDINIDKTPPVITGSKAPLANAAGWNNIDVTVTFSCSDTGSGVENCGPASQVVTTEGAAQSRTGTATDKAGNQATATVSGINIDKTPPIVNGARTPAANAAGWNKTDVTVTFTCSDALSGIGTCPAPEVLSTDGTGQSRTGTAVDKAGNQATATVSGINIDKTPPVVTGSRAPALNASGWNNTDVTVTFSCADAGSGIETCGPTSQVVTTEGAGQSRTATATDKAGNQGSATVSGINIDKTPPVIIGARSPAPDASGWNTQDVTVTFSCSDPLSGVESCGPTPQVVSTEGPNQFRTGYAADKGGNTASVTVGGIYIAKNPATRVSYLTAQVNGLALDQGEKNSLLAKLEAAADALTRTNGRGAARQQLAAFVNQVEALKKSGRLGASAADVLILQAQGAMAQL